MTALIAISVIVSFVACASWAGGMACRACYRWGQRHGEAMSAARRQQIGADTAADLLVGAIECCDQALESEMAPLLPWSRGHVQEARKSLGKALQSEIDS